MPTRILRVADPAIRPSAHSRIKRNAGRPRPAHRKCRFLQLGTVFRKLPHPAYGRNLLRLFQEPAALLLHHSGERGKDRRRDFGEYARVEGINKLIKPAMFTPRYAYITGFS